MSEKELDELLSDDFLDSLDIDDVTTELGESVKPDWLPSNQNHLVYKGWEAILVLKAEKEKAIKEYKKIANNKTPKSLYEMKKTEVGRAVGDDQRYIFYGKGKHYEEICKFFDEQNEQLLNLFKDTQEKLASRQKSTGIRVQKKEQIVNGYQQLRDENEQLRRQNAKDMLDMSIGRLPLDLQILLKSTRKKV